jgi:tRNA(Ile)-lysidine synthase TilS/MesJ
MQTFSPFDPFNTLKKAELPSRVVEEVYPIFERVLAPELDVIIGVSSGVDSMAVVCLLALRYVQRQRPLTHLHIVHCNHKIRKQSEIEAAFIQAFFS